MSKFRILQASPTHVQSISSLAAKVYPDTPGWPIEKLKRHQVLFPAGQIVALDTSTEEVVGASLNLIVDWPTIPFPCTYRDLVGDGWFSNHAPKTGRFLYSAELMVKAENRRTGVGGSLLRAQMDLVQALGLFGVRGSVAIPGGELPGGVFSEGWGGCDLRNFRSLPAIAIQLRWGAAFLGMLHNHFDRSQSSSRHALLVERLRP